MYIYKYLYIGYAATKTRASNLDTSDPLETSGNPYI